MHNKQNHTLNLQKILNIGSGCVTSIFFLSFARVFTHITKAYASGEEDICEIKQQSFYCWWHTSVNVFIELLN